MHGVYFTAIFQLERKFFVSQVFGLISDEFQQEILKRKAVRCP